MTEYEFSDIEVGSNEVMDIESGGSINYIPMKLPNPSFMRRDRSSFKCTKQYSKNGPLCLICITVYNENARLLYRTLRTILLNYISYLKMKIPESRDWVVVIIQDGREIQENIQLDPKEMPIFEFMSAKGLFKSSLMKKYPSNSDQIFHVFESGINISNYSPLKVFFCVKEFNRGKLNSHLWFFHGFCQMLDPKYIILLDCGSQPGHNSILEFIRQFEKDPNLAASCGELCIDRVGFNPTVWTQIHEYKISSIVDKPLESVLGFISVLPGAFSAYRWEALQYDENDDGPLKKYFHHLTPDLNLVSEAFDANMALAEDRLLSWELISRKNAKWKIKYIKDAYCYTDPPRRLVDLINQRRRWLNGTFFNLIYALYMFFFSFQVCCSTNHSIFRKFRLLFIFTYDLFLLVISLFSPAALFLVFNTILFKSTLSDDILDIIFISWITILLIQFVLAFMPTKQCNFIYKLIALYYIVAMIMMYVIYFSTLSLDFEDTKIPGLNVDIHLQASDKRGGIKRGIKGKGADDAKVDYIFLAVLATLFLQLFTPLLHGLEHFFTLAFTFIPYMVMWPIYVNILQIRAFLNLHDISWGTRGPKGHKTGMKFKIFRWMVAILWAASNIAFFSLFFWFGILDVFVDILFYIIAFTTCVRFLGSLFYLMGYWCS